MTYAVVWSEAGRPRYAGRLELAGRSVVLTGTAAGGRACRRRLRIGDVAAVRVDRTAEGERTLVLDTRAGGRIEISSLEGLGALHELATELADQHARAVA